MPPTDEPATARRSPSRGPGTDLVTAVQQLGRSPGATATAVDATTGELLTSTGPAQDAAVIPALRAMADAVQAARRDAGALEDLIVTTDRAFHLLRHLPLGGASGAWVHLRVDRSRANLARARRELAAAAGERAPAPARARRPVPTALPRRTPAAAPAPYRPPAARPAGSGPALPVPNGSWRTDVDTLRRLLAGLHRLN